MPSGRLLSWIAKERAIRMVAARLVEERDNG
jgi:hypothetical protein